MKNQNTKWAAWQNLKAKPVNKIEEITAPVKSKAKPVEIIEPIVEESVIPQELEFKPIELPTEPIVTEQVASVVVPESKPKIKKTKQ